MIYSGSGYSYEFLEFRLSEPTLTCFISACLENILKNFQINKNEESIIPNICRFIFHTADVYSTSVQNFSPKNFK